VLPSADLDRAATAIVRSAIGMTGQACQSLERVLVHESVFDAFLGLVVKKVSQLALNWPDIGQGQVGPLIFAPQAKVLSAQLEDARQHGATIHCGGMLEDHDGGAWCQPTVITGVTPDMLLLREETFGPLIPLMPFATTEEAVASANDSEFGLSAAVFAADTAEAIAVAEQLEVGAVSINDASLTGLANDVEKNSFRYSGMGGSRMGDSGLRRFLRKRALLIQTGEPASMAIFDEGQVAG
jgi:acyl-CoA reductase-like NAD-dependent aldehyde dehydrogenase